jgi:hypothetical protein
MTSKKVKNPKKDNCITITIIPSAYNINCENVYRQGIDLELISEL